MKTPLPTSIRAILICAALLSSCSKDKNESPAAGTGGAGNPQKGCPATPFVSDETSGGCRIRLVTPSPCEEIDLSNDRVYEFAWTNDGTRCETPYKAYLGGSPISRDGAGNLTNVYEISLPASDGEVSGTGGIARLRARDLEGLESANGVYEWTIASFHGSHPASQFFRVKK